MKKRSIKKSEKIVVLMGVLKFWEGQGNCTLRAPAWLLNRESFPTIFFSGRDISEKEVKEERTFKCLFCYLCVAHRWVRDDFEFAVDNLCYIEFCSCWLEWWRNEWGMDPPGGKWATEKNSNWIPGLKFWAHSTIAD